MTVNEVLDKVRIGIELAQSGFKIAQSTGVTAGIPFGDLINPGLMVLDNTVRMIEDISSGSTDWDNLTPDEIRAKLTPPTWEDLQPT
jgi:hypothetical protein